MALGTANIQSTIPFVCAVARGCDVPCTKALQYVRDMLHEFSFISCLPLQPFHR